MLFCYRNLTAVVAVWLVVAAAAAVAELRRFKHQAKSDDGSLAAMVVGDWGRRGSYNQSQVAVQMGRIGAESAIDFVISTGDNFYPDGLKAVDDPAFDESFINIYTAPSLQKQWYTVLGNHDYRGNVFAQLSPVLREKDSRWLCLRSYIVNTEFADFFFIDTTPFQDKYFFEPKDHTYDWRDVIPRRNYLSNLLTDLDLALKESNTRWKIVVGHHTIRSFGHHGDTVELVHNLLPLLEANAVDFYINGHDHCLQHIGNFESPLHFLTSGGGSKAWGGNLNWSSDLPMDMKFYYDGQGFMTLQIDPNSVGVIFYDVTGSVLHEWTVDKPQRSVA